MIVKRSMFPHRNFHKYSVTHPDGKTHNQNDHVLIEERLNWNVINGRSLKGTDCDTDH